ncbi:MAG TPA: zincin-like metallopeptidase domain-containing protein [Verrucomicrobiae bacterium]|nr:zincin-like metallopeptidase domain-containing protein [Verrucomicrobiae bacterium]
MNTTQHASVYDHITERIIALLEKGTVPWRKPWKVQTGLPRNLVSKKPYRGINAFLLHSMHYESPFWLTYRQALELGGNVRKGEKSCPVVFWKRLEIEDQTTGEMEKIPLMRFYSVFNAAQCDGLKSIPATPETIALTKPDEIVAAMPMRPEIKHGLDKAYYSPRTDMVAMPNRKRFTTDAGYHSTLFHELIHSTGHQSRLNRPTLTESAGFGSNPYCKEELIAEMGAAFLCGQAGIAEQILENSAAYIQNWLEQLQNDKKLIVQAAAQAQRAADFILGIKFEEATGQN